MFGLEKRPGEKFAFDLEKEIKANPQKRKEILEKAEARTREIKKSLREGASKKDFDKLGILLYGYTALQEVLQKVR